MLILFWILSVGLLAVWGRIFEASSMLGLVHLCRCTGGLSCVLKTNMYPVLCIGYRYKQCTVYFFKSLSKILSISSQRLTWHVLKCEFMSRKNLCIVNTLFHRICKMCICTWEAWQKCVHYLHTLLSVFTYCWSHWKIKKGTGELSTFKTTWVYTDKRPQYSKMFVCEQQQCYTVQ